MKKVSLLFLSVYAFSNCSLRATDNAQPTYKLPVVAGAIAFLNNKIMASNEGQGLCLRDFHGAVVREYADEPAEFVVSFDGREMAASTGADVLLFDVERGLCTKKILAGTTFKTQRLCIADNVISRSDIASCSFVDKRVGIVVDTYSTNPDGTCDHVMNRSGREIVFIQPAGDGSKFYSWDLGTRACRVFRQSETPCSFYIDWAADSMPIVVGNGSTDVAGNCVCFVDILNGNGDHLNEKAITLPVDTERGNCLSVKCDQSGKLFAAADEQGNVFICDPATGKITRRLKMAGRPGYGTSSFSWDKNGEHFAGVSLPSNDAKCGHAEIWDLQVQAGK